MKSLAILVFVWLLTGLGAVAGSIPGNAAGKAGLFAGAVVGGSALATVFLIPSTIEPLVWLVIFGICAYVMATRASGRHFLHGLLVSMVNSIWVTAAHIRLFDRYVANHPDEAAMMTSTPLAASPRVMMALTGPVIGVASGLVLGAFAVVAGRLIAARNRPLGS